MKVRKPALGLLVAVAILVSFLSGCTPQLPLHRAPLPFRQAEDSFKLGNYDRAVHGYRIFIDSNEMPELVPQAYFRLARAEFRLRHYDRCIAALDELQRRYPGTEWREVYEMRADAEYSRGNPVTAVLFWERAHEEAKRPRRLLLRQRISEASAKMDAETAARARKVVAHAETRALIDASRGPGAPAVATPHRDLTPSSSSVTPIPVPAIAGMVPVASAKVAVFLPLSGKYEAYGRRSLAGIELAFNEAGIDLLVRDTEGEAHIARAALDELLTNNDVVAVLGPLRSKVAQAINPRAERAGLPLFSLAQNNSITGRYVMQTAMTHEMQAWQLADFATRVIGLRKFGVLFPRDSYGTALSDAFREEVSRRGARVVGSLAYEPGRSEFSVEVLSVQRWVDADGLEAVFIPDSAAAAGVLARALRQARPSVFLLGSNDWHDPGELGAVADALDGAVFVDGFFVGSQRAATQRFLNAFRAVHGDMPGVLEAQAYDAAMVVRQALSSSETTSRNTLIDVVRAIGRFEGAAGALTFRDGGVERELFVLKLDGTRIREVTSGADSGASSVSFVPSRPITAPVAVP